MAEKGFTLVGPSVRPFSWAGDGREKKEGDSDNYELRLYINNPEAPKNLCYFLPLMIFKGFT
jgi:hypothetical protein